MTDAEDPRRSRVPPGAVDRPRQRRGVACPGQRVVTTAMSRSWTKTSGPCEHIGTGDLTIARCPELSTAHRAMPDMRSAAGRASATWVRSSRRYGSTYDLSTYDLECEVFGCGPSGCRAGGIRRHG